MYIGMKNQKKNPERNARSPKTDKPKTNIWKMNNINFVSVIHNI
jgi:hypothetical protein